MMVIDGTQQVLEKFEDVNALHIIEKLYEKKMQEAESKTDRPSTKHILVVNKMDEIRTTKQRDDLNLAIEVLVNKQFKGLFAQIFFVSAKTGQGMEELIEWAKANAFVRSWSFSSSVKSLTSPLQRVSEVIREKIFCYLDKEVPYNVFQENADWTEYADGGLRVEQILHVPSPGMKVSFSPFFSSWYFDHLVLILLCLKKIVIGKEGIVVKRIAEGAAADLSVLLKRKVHITLVVKITKQPPTSSVDICS